MKIKIAKNIAWQKIRNLLYIVDQRTGYLYQLDGISLDFWELILLNNDFEQAVKELSSMYEVLYHILYSDMKDLVYELKNSLLLEVYYDWK